MKGKTKINHFNQEKKMWKIFQVQIFDMKMAKH